MGKPKIKRRTKKVALPKWVIGKYLLKLIYFGDATTESNINY